jgi:hypothetical protein
MRRIKQTREVRRRLTKSSEGVVPEIGCGAAPLAEYESRRYRGQAHVIAVWNHRGHTNFVMNPIF